MTKPFDSDALKVGAAYQRGRGSLIEAGRLLAGVKATLSHGEWLPWLKANADALGFGESTAARLMKLAANSASTRDIWGNGERGQNLDTWLTNQRFAELIRRVLVHIDVDPCGNAASHKILQPGRTFTIEDDGLAQEWWGTVFLNPPYQQKAMAAFIRKLLAEIEAGRTTEAIVCIPAWTDSAWFHELLPRGVVGFVRGRVPFLGPDGAKPTSGPSFPSLFVYVPGTVDNSETFRKVFSEVGTVR